MARRSDHSREEIKAMAIAQAIRILNEEGLAGLSTRNIARAIGYTVGTLYLVFKNLDELILHINAATLMELELVLTEKANRHSSPEARIKAVAQGYLHYAQSQHVRWSLLFTHQLPGDQSIPEWFSEKVRSLFAIVEQPLRSLNSQASDREYQVAVRALWGGVHGVCELSLGNKLQWGESVDGVAAVDTLVGDFLYGFMHRK